MPIVQFTFEVSLLIRLSSVCVILLALSCPSACRRDGSGISNALTPQTSPTGAALFAPRATADVLTKSPFVWLSIPSDDSWAPSTLERKRAVTSTRARTAKSPTPAKSTTRAKFTSKLTSSTAKSSTPVKSTSKLTSSTAKSSTRAKSTSKLAPVTTKASTSAKTKSSTAKLTSTHKALTTPRSTTSRPPSATTQPPKDVCGCESCRGNSCHRDEPRSLPESNVPALSKRAMRGPENYHGSVVDFFMSELRAAKPNLLRYQGRQLPSAKLIYFKDLDFSTGMVGLWGCTSVIVLSKKAVWISHFWETLFCGNDGETIIRSLRYGAPEETRNGVRSAAMPGLGNLIGPEGPFHVTQEPQILIVTPGKKHYPDDPMYDMMIGLMQEELLRMVANAPVRYHVYGITDKKVSRDEGNPSGKILVQYDAAQDDIRNPRRYRVWVEAAVGGADIDKSWPYVEPDPPRCC